MDKTLNRLLAAELEAERLVEAALAEKERMTSEALGEAHVAEERFSARTAEIHAAFMDRARDRAAQTVAELQRRYDERNKALRNMAEEHEIGATDAAMGLLLESDVD